MEGIDNAIKSVAYEYHWTPKTLANMYCDDFDLYGIMYWHEELVRIEKESKKKN